MILEMILSVIVNAIPVGGMIFKDWSPATGLTLYWCENLIGSLLIAIRIAIHRRLTHKRGHERLQINQVTTTTGGKRSYEKKASYLGEFLTLSIAFTIAHGVFLAAFLAIALKIMPDWAQVFQGLKWMALVQVAGLVVDLTALRTWPFAQLKKRADYIMGRIVLVHIAIMGGMLLAAKSSRPDAFFAVFGFLKGLADISSLIPYQAKVTEEAPRWFLWFANKTGNGKHWKTGQDVATWWRETTREELKRIAEDEEVVQPKGGTTSQSARH
jgi:Family of unknown function (DUF6498)